MRPWARWASLTIMRNLDSHAVFHAWRDSLGPDARLRIEGQIAEIVSAAMERSEVTRCSCPVGFGAVADPDCPVHRGARHTITGPARVLVQEHPSQSTSHNVEEGRIDG